jgi:hypothetical protein
VNSDFSPLTRLAVPGEIASAAELVVNAGFVARANVSCLGQILQVLRFCIILEGLHDRLERHPVLTPVLDNQPLGIEFFREPSQYDHHNGVIIDFVLCHCGKGIVIFPHKGHELMDVLARVAHRYVVGIFDSLLLASCRRSIEIIVDNSVGFTCVTLFNELQACGNCVSFTLLVDEEVNVLNVEFFLEGKLCGDYGRWGEVQDVLRPIEVKLEQFEVMDPIIVVDLVQWSEK